jgi:hypothetical protein
LTIGALLGSGLAFGALALATGAFNVPLVVQAAITMAAAGAILARFRWAPLVGGMVGAAILLVTAVVPIARAYASYHLSHPAEATGFSLTLVRVVCLFVAAWAGIGMAVQNARVTDPKARRLRCSAIPAQNSAVCLLPALMLLDDVTAVDHDRLAGHVARGFRGEEGDHGGDLIRAPKPPDGGAASRLHQFIRR